MFFLVSLIALSKSSAFLNLLIELKAFCCSSSLEYVDTEFFAKTLFNDLFKALGDQVISANINYEYELKDAVQAHTAIESGKTLGASVLIP